MKSCSQTSHGKKISSSFPGWTTSWSLLHLWSKILLQHIFQSHKTGGTSILILSPATNLPIFFRLCLRSTSVLPGDHAHGQRPFFQQTQGGDERHGLLGGASDEWLDIFWGNSSMFKQGPKPTPLEPKSKKYKWWNSIWLLISPLLCVFGTQNTKNNPSRWDEDGRIQDLPDLLGVWICDAFQTICVFDQGLHAHHTSESGDLWVFSSCSSVGIDLVKVLSQVYVGQAKYSECLMWKPKICFEKQQCSR